MNKQDVAAVILSGGAGRRMGGQDKGLVAFRDKQLIAHTVNRIKDQVSTIYISANRNLSVYQQYNYPVLTDDSDDYLGPMAGLVKVWPRVQDYKYLLSCPVDTPFLPEDLVKRLLSHIREHDVAYAASCGNNHYLHALFNLEKVNSPESVLANGQRSIHKWYRTINAIAVPFEVSTAFNNLNSQALVDKHQGL